MIAIGLLAAAAGTVFEALLFRSLLDLTWHLTLSGQRLAASSMVIGFVGVLLAIEGPAVFGLLRLGRHVDLQLRMRLLRKIPRLSDRYFQSRLISDMAFRVHSLHLLRELPDLAGHVVRLTSTLMVTAIAIAWLYPGAALPVVTAALVAVGVPLAVHPILVERELRVRELSASLSRFYLDALIGARAIQAHGAARTLRAAQVPQLAQWAAAGLRQQALIVRAEAAQMALSVAAIVWLVYAQAARAQTPAGFLLLIYWALSIPAIGRQLASIIWHVPALRNTSLRFLEPLGSPEDALGTAEPAAGAARTRGVKVDIDDVTAIAAGHVILDGVSVRLAPGEHVAIVGPSGAGKSSLVGLLLGWHRPAQGRVLIDDRPLDADRLAALRGETAWIDPEVHLFHATLYDNLRYGNGEDIKDRVGALIGDSDSGIVSVLQRLPDGLQTSLGEGGGLLSGGEGQRVRIGRGLARVGVRLAILDEPAHGLDRAERSRLLVRARRHFAGVTLLVVSHDVSETLAFDRVLVLERGRIVEEGAPRELADRPGSRYRALLDEERLVQCDLWGHPLWRCVRMTDGILTDAAGAREWTLV